MIGIRAAEPADAASVAAIYAPHVLTGTASFEIDPPDARAMRTRMAASDGLYPWMVVTNGDTTDGGVIGYAFASKFRDRPAYKYVCETSIYMTDASSGQGAGRLLYAALVDTLRAQGFVHAIGAITLPNDRLIKLHEAVGYRRAGVYREVGFKHGQWIDVGFWQCQLNDPVVPPVEPRRFSDVGVVRG
ncbi:GNAT family N-acetyltransferase [Sphingomonas sp. LM7]|uniref:GNAT family N-acetyltransferase n=1 Tax=Sphingomonas sp. LM7 TaxID=1938607 RepID=UPI000983CA2E|nr:GNAT family N-acetyltransferase [Sphingomonas sp. LM7]AQR75188.1 GNAT family N-acetyltransferase [Sphingomonas sp. LM7]